MKRLYTLLVTVAISISFFAQSPQKMSYQAVIRNTTGGLVTNHAVGMRVSILQGSATGTVVYSETYNPNPQANANGLVTLEIGTGLPITGTFASINWAAGTYYIKTETDPAGGTNYSVVGTSQLTSVPYALHAKNAANYAETDPVFNTAPAKGITSGNISNWNTAYSWGNHSGLYKPNSYVPVWPEIIDKPVFAPVATSGSYTDLINKPTIINSQWTTSSSGIYYTGSVGIGVTSPAYKLEINGGQYSYIKFFNETSGGGVADGAVIGTTPAGNPLWIWNYENGNIHFATNNQRRMDILNDGRIIMNKSLNINQGVTEGGALLVNDAQAIWWNGTYFSWGYGSTWNYFADRVSIGRATDPGASYMLYVQGTAYATGSWSSSDASFKKNISAINNPLNKLMKIRGTKFEFRSDEFKDYQFAEGPQFGFIAQELEKVFPEVVKTDNDGYKSVNYNSMVPVVLEGIKEQQEMIEKMRKEIDELKALVNSLITKQSAKVEE